MPDADCAILSIGDELILGLTVDTNAAWLCAEMAALGWTVRQTRIVPDRQEVIIAALRDLASSVSVLLVTGGLGPTEDDRTRHAVAAAMGAELIERPELVAQIEERFRRFERPMRPSNRIQACIPDGADGIPNPCGTAPGIRARLGEACVFCMPGVPKEMKDMFRRSVAPALPGHAADRVRRMRRLHLFGAGESTIGDAIRDLMDETANPLIGTAVDEGVITVRLIAQGDSPDEAAAILEETDAKIRRRLPGLVFGVDGETLAAATVRDLADRKETVALAESCTGGLMAKTLTDIPGSSSVFGHGFVTYANEAKEAWLGVPAEVLESHGAVSQETVAAMARGARARSGATYALAATGIAGPGGGGEGKPVGTVWLALASPLGVHCLRRVFVGDRAGNRIRTVHAALDLLRRAMNRLPMPEECAFAPA